MAKKESSKENKEKNRKEKEKGKAEKKENGADNESQDWFEDHEPYKEEELSEDELEELETSLEDEAEFKNRMMHFLTSQKRDVSLENMLEIPESDIDEPTKNIKDDDTRKEDNFDYIPKPKAELMKYQAFEPETNFSRPNMSSTERILEEQKQLYKHLKTVGEEMVGNEKSEWNPITPEDTMKKDYLKKRKI
ncbi:hypothetical protein J4411_02025 [Candidatus Pacearchaeota archaeon]|nr:hypothetical protein [Candidatus Pacearchaeota archaeon]